MLTIPNFLTLLRIIAIPAYLILVNDGRYGLALTLFMAAGITDAIDGVIARLTDTRSDLGATLDPLADKLLLVSSFVILTWLGALPSWLLILVLTRDAVVLMGLASIYIFTAPIAIAPNVFGKVNTFNEMFCIGFGLVTLARPEMPMAYVNLVTWCLAAVTTTISGIQYVYTGLLWYQQHSGPSAPTT